MASYHVQVPSKPGIGTLIRFARLASAGRKESITLPALADVLVREVGANAVAILQVEGSGAVRFLPSPHLPPELESINVDEDPLDSELERRVLAQCGERFGSTCTRPLVAGEGLFGSVTLFFAPGNDCTPEQMEVAEGLIDLAAMSLAGIARLNQLAESHAELRASQERLIRSEKMRALGEMAAGVSHDLKNILNPLSLQMQLAQRRIDQGRPQDAAKCLGEMKQVLARGVQTIDRLRDYGRQSPEPRPEETVDLAHVAREASEIARPRIAARGMPIRYRFEEHEPALVRGLSGEIVSALVNLTVNAIDAMTTAGTITFRSGSAEGARFVEVTDDGPGMPPEIERRVFEPFFSTKGDQGTGLGLAMVYACMRRHAGKVTLTTAPGEGTTFRLSFPSSSSIAPPAAPAEPHS